MTNRLAQEKSPYLLQHAHNPVDWYPWVEEAFASARSRDVPIFLSIGYSACHWCHVMERESFEDEAVARFLNEHFVSIKVDREERPDIDEIYMSAVQAISGSGGWPMSVFLTPDLDPFYAGTYFPPQPAYGRPSFLQLLQRIDELWNSQRESVMESSKSVLAAIRESLPTNVSALDVTDAAKQCYRYFAQSYDRQYGGFGSAPKFPRPVQFDFLLEYWRTSGDAQALRMATDSLRHMATGGIYDQLGGGFHRYSVDRFWRVSHFEKMLYDQAQLTHSLLDAWQITQDRVFAIAARGVCDYVLRELEATEGGYYSAEDADSEGEEGKFYVWTKAEIEQLLGDQSDVILRRFGITKEGNFEHGKNVLHVSESIDEIARRRGIPSEEVHVQLEESLRTLYAYREGRVRPHLDDKILTSWNGLMIGAMARAGAVLAEDKYLRSAKRAADFLWEQLRTDGILHHRWRDGDTAITAMLDDYAFLISGLLHLHQATLESKWLTWAVQLQEQQDSELWDVRSGGYFTTRESTDIIVRKKNGYDGAEPSGNSISAVNLITLAILTERSEYRERAQKIVDAFSPILSKHPYAMPELLVAVMRLSEPAKQIVFRGEESQVHRLRQALQSTYLPDIVVMDAASATGEFAATLGSEGFEVTAYYCRGFACELPVHDEESLLKLVGAATRSTANA